MGGPEGQEARDPEKRKGERQVQREGMLRVDATLPRVDLRPINHCLPEFLHIPWSDRLRISQLDSKNLENKDNIGRNKTSCQTYE